MALQLNAIGPVVLQWGLMDACFLCFAGRCSILQVPYLGSDAVYLR